MKNPTYTFCECESELCNHTGSCHYEPENIVDRNFLGDYYVSGWRQTLCPHCANHAHDFCRDASFPFSVFGGVHDKNCDCRECEPEPVDAEERFAHQ